jgi:2'-5' RNA ligase
MDQPLKSLHEISHTELRAAVDELCARLGIRSQLPEVYDLHLTLLRERERAANYIHQLNVGDD